MPLFNRKQASPPPPPPEPQRKGIFHRKESPPSPATTTTTTSTNDRRTSLFSRRRSSSTDRVTTASSTSPTSRNSLTHNLMHRHEHAGVTEARNRVVRAEEAEKQADIALAAARAKVAEARRAAELLEKEAEHEAKLARIKQQQAAHISDRARPLGRHDNHR